MTDKLATKTCSCILLSGGLSSRMSIPKALLRYSESENFMQHLISVYLNSGVFDIGFVYNHEIEQEILRFCIEGVRYIKNEFPDRGRLYSIQLGLSLIQPAHYCFIQNIDSPFVDEALVNELYKNREMVDYITPVSKGKGGHPVLLAKGAMAGVLDEKDNSKSLKEVLSNFVRRKVETNSPKCLININTPEEYRQHFANLN